ncbi:AbrB/MazE/SpoVT family DNA-binding domain-containing protein [Halosaccharopolyspora lacisalsi]|nr:AbrB/MazE/SpoVT family DNA-binding domain-containing protein [Halosaccharopolyspora lacisalsi]
MGSRMVVSGPLSVVGLEPDPQPQSVSRLYRIVAVDDRGRVAEQSVMAAVGWLPGQRLSIGVVAGSIVVRSDPAGVFRLARRGHLPLPATARRWTRLEPGQRVLLTADSEQSVVVVSTLASLERMLSEHHAAVLGGGAS